MTVKVSNLIKYIVFADDTGENLQRLPEVINTEMTKLQHWFKIITKFTQN